MVWSVMLCLLIPEMGNWRLTTWFFPAPEMLSHSHLWNYHILASVSFSPFSGTTFASLYLICHLTVCSQGLASLKSVCVQDLLIFHCALSIVLSQIMALFKPKTRPWTRLKNVLFRDNSRLYHHRNLLLEKNSKIIFPFIICIKALSKMICSRFTLNQLVTESRPENRF